MSSQYDELRPTSGWDRLANGEFGAPLQSSKGLASWLRYCTDVAQGRSAKLCTMFGRLLGFSISYIRFRWLLTPNGILPGAKFTLRPRELAACPPQSAPEQHFRDLFSTISIHFNSGRHLYSAGRPSRWAPAHILVIFTLANKVVLLSLC